MTATSRRSSGARGRTAGAAVVAVLAALAVTVPAGAVAADEADVRYEVHGTVVHVVSDPKPADGGEGFGETSTTEAFVDVAGSLVPADAALDPALENGAEVVVTIAAEQGLSEEEAVAAAAATEGQQADLRAEVVEVDATDDAAAAHTDHAHADLAQADLAGVHTLVVLPVHWGNQDATTTSTLTNAANGTATYWERQSANALDVQTEVRGWQAIAAPTGCDVNTIMDRALTAHGVPGPSSTRHVAVYFPDTLGCPFAGRASITGGAIWINGAPTTYVLAHELGHNFGLGHANTLHCTSGGARVPLADPTTCTYEEYGDDADVMGQGNWRLTQPGNISTGFAHFLGWASVRDVTAPPTTTQTVDLAPLAQVRSLRALRLPVPWGSVYLDYRPAAGPDVHVPAWAGVQGHYIKREPWGVTSFLLDLQPAKAPFAAANLPVGGSWAVPGVGVTVQTVSTGSTGARLSLGAGAQGQQVQRYVTRVYNDLFGRGPDPTGLNGWTSALLAGTPRIAVANAITYSDEYRSKLIAGSYSTYLGRGPDPSGAAGWLAAMRAGSTIQQMEAGFIASNEYYAKAGGTDAGWVRRLYQHVLGRGAAPSEVQAWTSALAQGGTRQQVAMGFLVSTEHLTTVVDGYYRDLLGRGIDPSGAHAWVVAIQGGARVEAIIGGIIASDEYYSKV